MRGAGPIGAGWGVVVRWWRGLGWPGRALCVAGVIQFALAATKYYHGSGPDLYRVHVAVKAFLQGGRLAAFRDF